MCEERPGNEEGSSLLLYRIREDLKEEEALDRVSGRRASAEMRASR